MSDCSNPGAYYDPLRIVVRFANGLRDFELTLNRLTPQGERSVEWFEVEGERFTITPERDWDDMEVTD